ncbi:hypothetical protein E1B28_006663 [Marasmius oreades]|uniref:Nephrocystin 3-like N-terminal domain-containing protein n=1 Tax=Marasmius oreades TaxID=181124 RepID=A0A9P7S2E5_9AGAR|nr:uncharacterized protein E1B28_007818 [Marasmius oreades]XP_043012450.1 uncharacterized protein E1B28_006663 [Marasmius oreades]KAG7094211.1 hypothetical protein E1B28_007818 [Marasmius oreades]KAG7095980.1 hypothetical protein E1B28_006663 [Marasmius oreades]
MSSSSQSTTNHMFHGMQYSTINGGEFYNVGHDLVRNFHTTAANPQRTLWDAIAGVGASYNSALQFDRGSCLPGTREAVLRDIHEWSSSESDSSKPVCWLSGTAGVGKSAIALTVAKSCAENNRLAASFFFFRSDPKRNNPSSLMLTIAHGLVTTIPSLRPIIEQKIATDPRILEANLDDQFRELVVLPLLNVSPSLIVHPSLNSSPSSKRRSCIPRWGQRWRRHRPEQPLPQRVPQSVQQPESLPQAPAQKDPNLVIIDGLDECKDSDTQLRIISILTSAYQHSPRFPLRLLICSCPESWIREAFDLPKYCILTKHIKLDDSYVPNQDIERYFRSEFTSIHTNIKYKRVEFPNPWPSKADIECLVDNASAQFIYAITAMKFVKAEYSSPSKQLCIVLDSRSNRISPKSPFPELDNLYHIILSTHPEQAILLSILSAILLLPERFRNPKFIEILLGFSPGEVDLSLRGMHSVLDIRGATDDIRVYHTSFTDYLCTKSRSAEFYINEPRQRDFLACRWLMALGELCKAQEKSFHSWVFRTFLGGWGDFCSSVKQPSKQLLYELGSLDLLSLVVATGVSLQVGISPTRESWHRWATLFRSFRTVASWLDQKGVDLEIIERFVNVQDRIQVNPSLDEEIRSHLESWVVFNVTRCESRCPLTDRVEASVAKLLGGAWNSEPSSGPLSLAGPTSTPGTSIDIPSGCFRTVKCLCYDLQTSMARYQNSKAESDISEIRWTVRNLLDSTLLESCVPQPELLSILDTISDVVKMYYEISRRRFLIFRSRRDKLLSWCESFPDGYAECTDLVKNQIFPLIDFGM